MVVVRGESAGPGGSCLYVVHPSPQDGQYTGLVEDQGYQSSLSSPNESQIKRTGHPSNKQLLTVQKVWLQ